MIELATDENPWGLTRRQCQVLEVLARTGSNNDTCAELTMNSVTLANMLRRACKRVGVKNRIQLLAKWLRWIWENEAGRAA